jgi:hypothetical protein
VPAQDSLRLDEEHGVAPAGNEPCEQDEYATFIATKGGALDGARGDDELLAQERVLGDQLGARPRHVSNEPAHDTGRSATIVQPDCQHGGCARNRKTSVPNTCRSERSRTQ